MILCFIYTNIRIIPETTKFNLYDFLNNLLIPIPAYYFLLLPYLCHQRYRIEYTHY